MRFRIVGADRETGVEATWEADFDSVQQARQHANAAGYLVNAVEPMSDVRAPAMAARSRSPVDQPFLRVLAGGMFTKWWMGCTFKLKAWTVIIALISALILLCAVMHALSPNPPPPPRAEKAADASVTQSDALYAAVKRRTDWNKQFAAACKLDPNTNGCVDAWKAMGLVKDFDVDYGWANLRDFDDGRKNVLGVLYLYGSRQLTRRGEELESGHTFKLIVFDNETGESLGSAGWRDNSISLTVFR